MIQGIPVTSSNVALIGWAMNSLFVQFKHGGCYRYDGCTLALYRELIDAESTGTFINKVIKPQCTFTKLETNPFN